MIFGYFILLIAIAISAIAAWYSIAGLIAIFAAAAIPVMIMGGALEAGKIVATVWLHNNWERAGWRFKVYLIPAVVLLMVLTSMGIFGFLSKAHLDQNIISGDSQSRLALYDEKITNERDTINNARTLLGQLDKAVTDISGAPDREVNGRVISSAERALQVRRQQARERAALTQTIEQSQTRIVKLQEERAPLAAEFRKIEAEVGPIKYIAALLYGDNPDQNLLEQAVRWVIILIVIVFDPLALTLILAANKQLEWARKGRGGWVHDEETKSENEPDHVLPENRQGFSFFEMEEKPPTPSDDTVIEPVLDTPLPPEDLGVCPKCETPIQNAPGIGPFCPNKDCDVVDGLDAAREEMEQKELEEFFWRGRMIARALDQQEHERRVNEANAQLAELEPEPVEVDVESVQQAQLEQQQLNQERQALEALIGSYDELLEDNDRLQSQLDRRMTEITQLATAKTHAEESLMVVGQELEKIIDERDQLLAAGEILQNEKEQLEKTLAELTQAAEPTPEFLSEPEPLVVETQPVTVPTPPVFVPTAKVSAIVDSPMIAGKGVQWNFDQVRTARHGIESQSADDNIPESGNAAFGVRFPESAGKGDMFLRVDMIPNRAYKFNGSKWIEIDKNKTDRFAYDEAYISHLSDKLITGEYDIDDLNDVERAQVDEYRRKNTLL